MAEEDKRFSKDLIGKTVVSKTGKRFGEVGDLVSRFVTDLNLD